MRVRFVKTQQREFIKKVMENIGCPSLSELANRLDVNYSTLKNYFIESRLIPLKLFEDLCKVSELDFGVEKVVDFWGQVKGGKKSRKYGPTRNRAAQ